MRWGLAVVVVVVVWIGNAQAKDQLSATTVIQTLPTTQSGTAPVEGVGEKYLKVCTSELKKRNLPANVADCEKLLERSHLMQSGAIWYLTQASDAEREAFGSASTLARYELVEPEVDPAVLVPLLLDEKESTSSKLVVHLARDVMKSGCGYYQIDVLMKALDNADALPQLPKQQVRKSGRVPYKGCLGAALSVGKASECLNPIFLPVTSEPSPNL